MFFRKHRFHPPSNLGSLLIGGSEIERLFEFRCLGLSLDPRLKLRLHIHDVVKKPVQVCSHSLLNKKCFKREVFKDVIQFCYLSKYSLLCCAWLGTFKSIHNPIFFVQRGIIRAMCGANRRTPSQGCLWNWDFSS